MAQASCCGRLSLCSLKHRLALTSSGGFVLETWLDVNLHAPRTLGERFGMGVMVLEDVCLLRKYNHYALGS